MSKLYCCSGCNYTSYIIKHVQRHIDRKNKCCEAPTIDSKIVSLQCDHCQKQISSASSLKRHQNTCKKTIQSKENQRILELEEQLKLKEKELQEALNKPTTVINNINNGTIILNGYRDTSFEHLKDKQFKKAIGRLIYCVPQLIGDVHFNAKAPENHNIYISNIGGKYAMVYDGVKWCSQPQDSTIDQLISDQEYAIEEWLGEGDRFPKEMAEFNRYLEKKENNKIKDEIKEEVRMLLYNNRSLIKR